MSKKSERNHELRIELIKRLESEDAEDLIGPMRECGQLIAFQCVTCGNMHDVPMRCKKRYCPACQPKIAAEKVAKWSGHIAAIKWPLFVTLTLSNSRDESVYLKLKKAWPKFRRRKLIREKVQGGVATYELTNKGNGWHPHLHAILDCRWLSLHVPEPLARDPKEVVAQKCALAKAELSQLWAKQLDQAKAIVDVARVYDAKKAPLEVLKYAMKGTDLVECPNPIAPMLRLLKGSRMLAGFGSMHPLPALDPEEKPEVACTKCGDTKSLLPADIIQYLVRSSDSHIPLQAPRSK